MRIAVEIEFEVEANDTDIEEGVELTKEVAMDAVERAIFHYLVFTESGENVVDWVDIYMEEFGNCAVSLGE